MGKYAIFVEEMKAAPMQFCPYLNQDKWAKDRVQNLQNFLWETTVPVSIVLFVSVFIPLVCLGYDGWVFRKLFGK